MSIFDRAANFTGDALRAGRESIGASTEQIVDSGGDFFRAVGRGDWESAGNDLLAIGAESANILSGGTNNLVFNTLRRITQPDIPAPDFEDRKNQISSANAPRRMVYGRSRVGGVARYAESSGGNDKFIHLIHIFAAHSCEAIEEIYFNDELAFIGTVPQGKFVGKATAIIETGKQTTANAAIVADTPANWTNDHKLLGHTYAYFKLEYDTDVFRSVPKITATVKGKDDILDPRTGLYGWTDNQALCTLDYMRNRYGFGADDSLIDLSSFADGANIADELVTSGVGTTEKRYTVNGSISIIDDPKGPLDNLNMSGFSDVQWIQGRFVFIPGVYREPISQNSLGTSPVTFDSTTAFTFDSDIWPTFDTGFGVNFKFTDDDLIGGISYTPSGDIDGRINALRGSYIDPSQNFEPVDFVRMNIESYEQQDKEILYADTKFQFINSGTMARRLSKIALERSRYGVRLSLRLKVRALEFGVGDRIEFESASEGLTNKVYRIDAISPSIDGADVSLSEDHPDVWAWTEGDALEVTPPPALNLPNPNVVSTPTGLTVAETVYNGNDQSSIKSRVTINWDDDDVIQRWEVQGSFYSGPFVDLTSFISTNSFILEDAQIGDWTFRVRAVNGIGAKSAYASSAFTTNGKTTVPPAISGFTGTRRPNGVEINWTESSEQDISHYEIRNGASWATGTPIRNTNGNGFLWEPESQTVSTLWIKAHDKSGGESATATSLIVGTGSTAVTSDTGPITNVKSSFNDDADGYFLGAGEFYVGNAANKLKFNTANGLEINTTDFELLNGSATFKGSITAAGERFKVDRAGATSITTPNGTDQTICSVYTIQTGVAGVVSYSRHQYGGFFQSRDGDGVRGISQNNDGGKFTTNSAGGADRAAVVAESPNGAAHIQMLTTHTTFPVASDGAIILGQNAGGDKNIYIRVRGQWRQLSWGGGANDGAVIF